MPLSVERGSRLLLEGVIRPRRRSRSSCSAADQLEVADVVDGEQGLPRSRAARPEVAKRLAEEVVAGHDHEIVVDRPDLEDEDDVADRAQAVILALRAVVDDLDTAASLPLVELPGELRVGDEIARIEADRVKRVEQPVEHGAAANRQQRLGPVERERVEPGRVARCEDEESHVGVFIGSDAS
jgi:hypothetical protein